jgi:hypothetical protein
MTLREPSYAKHQLHALRKNRILDHLRRHFCFISNFLHVVIVFLRPSSNSSIAAKYGDLYYWICWEVNSPLNTRHLLTLKDKLFFTFFQTLKSNWIGFISHFVNNYKAFVVLPHVLKAATPKSHFITSIITNLASTSSLLSVLTTVVISGPNCAEVIYLCIKSLLYRNIIPWYMKETMKK